MNSFFSVEPGDSWLDHLNRAGLQGLDYSDPMVGGALDEEPVQAQLYPGSPIGPPPEHLDPPPGPRWYHLLYLDAGQIAPAPAFDPKIGLNLRFIAAKANIDSFPARDRFYEQYNENVATLLRLNNRYQRALATRSGEPLIDDFLARAKEVYLQILRHMKILASIHNNIVKAESIDPRYWRSSDSLPMFDLGQRTIESKEGWVRELRDLLDFVI